MKTSDIIPGARLVLHSCQVQGHYVGTDGIPRTHFAVPGTYTVLSVEKVGLIERVTLKSDHPRSEPFVCTMYHLGAILGPWSVTDKETHG